MEIIKFKTNVDSQEALNKVAPYLDKEDSISKWSIDIESSDNVLSVSGTNIDPQTIKNVVEQAGFRVEIKRVFGLSGGDL